MWNPAYHNLGNSANVNGKGGLPSAKPKWVISKLGENDSFNGMIVAIDDSIYFGSRGDIYSIDQNSGDINWASEIGDRTKIHRGMAVIGDKLLTNWVLYNRHTGEVLVDLQKTKELEQKKFSSIWIYKDKFLRYLDATDPELITINPESYDIKSLPIRLYKIHSTDNLIYGWSENWEYTCYDGRTNSIIWTIDNKLFPELPIDSEFEVKDLPYISIHVFGEMLYQFNSKHKTIRCINNTSGEIIWELTDSSKIPHIDGSIDGVSIAHDLIYYSVFKNYDYRFIALDALTGEKCWEVDLGGHDIITPSLLINGDLLFHGKVIRNANTQLYAMDRYTGEVVWTADELQMSTHDLIGHENKIIYTNTFSEVRCYEWTEEYKSKFRDKYLIETENKKKLVNSKKKTRIFIIVIAALVLWRVFSPEILEYLNALP